MEYNNNQYNNNQYNNPYNQQQSWNNQFPQKSPNSGKATASLALGIASIATSILCCGGGGIISIACGVIGLILGINVRKEEPENSNAKIGFILSCIGLGLSVVMIIVAIALYTTGILAGIMSELY